MKVSELFSGVWIGEPLRLRNLYNKDELTRALSSPVRAQTVTVKNTQTGEVVGYRTLYQK